MRRYRGVTRAAQQARVGRLDRERRDRDHNAAPATLTANDLTAAIYRLQGERRTDNGERIRALLAEQARRRT